MSEPENTTANGQNTTSLSTNAAQQLATITKSAPQMQGITSRWLLKVLPWVQVRGGAYQVNRVATYTKGSGVVTILKEGQNDIIVPRTLTELPILEGFEHKEILNALASQFERQEYDAGEDIVRQGESADRMFIIVHGKVQKLVDGEYENAADLGMLMGGEQFGQEVLLGLENHWSCTYRTTTHCIVLSISRENFNELQGQHPTLHDYIERIKPEFTLKKQKKQKDPHREHVPGNVETLAGHTGEPNLPTTFVDYDIKPRVYELSVAQTVLRIHSRVADLYNDPMNQTEEQLKLTVESLRERQEYEMINNLDFGLLHNVEYGQRIPTRQGPPTPDDLDELITRRRDPQFIFAHPRAIAAFGRECNRVGIYPQSIDMGGHLVPAWRGIPVLPCSKIPISDKGTTSILIMRTGEKNQGVIGLNPSGLPDEYAPGLNVRFMGIDEKAVISYLVTAYFSAAILVPDALGMLEDVEVGRW